MSEPWLEPYRWRYYATAALRCGVPSMWLEDAAQDIAIACWRAGEETPTIVHRAAVATGRRYGAYRQYGERRTYAPLTVELDEARDVADIDVYASRDAIIDVQAAMPQMKPQYQREIARQLSRDGSERRSMADYKRWQHAKARLRTLCA